MLFILAQVLALLPFTSVTVAPRRPATGTLDGYGDAVPASLIVTERVFVDTTPAKAWPAMKIERAVAMASIANNERPLDAVICVLM